MKKLAFICVLTAFLGSAYGMIPINYEVLADAIYRAEGGRKASRPYGVMRDYCGWDTPYKVSQCRKGCIQTIEKRHRLWLADHEGLDFISYLGRSYAPTKGATNDPTGLNKNWVKNVKAIYAELSSQ